MAGMEDARRLAEEVLGHRMAVCTCGSDSAASAHLACEECGLVAWQIDGTVWGQATVVACPFSKEARDARR